MEKTSRWIVVATFSVLTAGLVTGLLSGCTRGTPVAGPPSSATPSAVVTLPTTVPPAPTSTPPTTATHPQPAPPPGKTAPAPTTARPPTVSAVSVTRTGGIAGVSQTVVIAADGSWIFTDRRNHTSQQGKLTAAQVTQLHQLVTAPALLSEAHRPPSGVPCSDGVNWSVTAGDLTVTEVQCGAGNRSATDAVIRFVSDVTAM